METHPADALIELSNTEGRSQKRTMSSWYWARGADGMMAHPVDISTLYRGQNKRHFPMLPSIARGLSCVSGDMAAWPTKDQALLVLRLAQAKWFVSQLEFHPSTNNADKEVINAKKSRWPLAQHYGLPTDYFDLSDSFDVSAFFATCYEEGGVWRPVENGIGVMYRVEIAKLKNRHDDISPLGPQYLPRPTEQSGWVFEVDMPFSHSFDGDPAVQVMQFEHSMDAGEYFLDKFDGGRKLFPPDPLADVAHEIITCNEIPSEFIEWALDGCHQQPFGARADQATAIKSEIRNTHSLTSNRRILEDGVMSKYMSDSEWIAKYEMPIMAKIRLLKK